MNKRLLATCLSFVALAALAVVPSIASASPELAQGGARLATGSSLSGTNTRNVLFETALGTFSCTASQLVGTLKVNSGKLIEAEIESGSIIGGGPEGKCKDGSLGGIEWKVSLDNLPWCMSSSSLGIYKARGARCNEAMKPIGLTLSSNLGSCTYTRTTLSLTSNTGMEPLVLSTAAGQAFGLVSSTWNGCHSSFDLNAAWAFKSNGANLKVQ
jgi:hypothetical protein